MGNEKSIRFEMRVEPEFVASVDEWRGEQSDLPSRAEAIRRLAQVGLNATGGSFEFLSMKFDILTAAATEGTSRLIDDGYVYAWERNLYPWFHSGAPWHQPFKNDFAVTEEMMSEAITFLDDRWIGNSAIPSFYELERLFDARSNASRWDRSKLISVCRYAFLCERFDARLFDRLLAKGEHPIEASLIVEQFNRDDAIYLM